MPLIDLNGLGHFKDKENAMIAEDFSASKAYAAGDYCYYNGTLYKFKTAHAAGAWTIADVEAAKLAHDVSDLKTAITENKESFESTLKLDKYVSIPFTDDGNGSINYSTGNVIAVSTANYTNYVDVSLYKTIKYNMLTTNGNVYTSKVGIAFYDSEKAYISGFNALAGATNGWQEDIIDVPTGAVYARFPFWNGSLSGTANEFYLYGISKLYDTTDVIKDFINGKNLFDKSTITSGKFINVNNGTLTDYSDAFTSDFIEIKRGTTYSYHVAKPLYGETSAKRLPLFDASHNFLIYASGTISGDVVTITIPQATYAYSENGGIPKYCRFTDYINQLDSTMFVEGDYPSKYYGYGANYLPNSYRLNDTQIEEVRSITTTGVLYGKKIAYNGDSIAESRLQDTNANNGGGYAKMIADLTNGTYENRAVSGGILASSVGDGGSNPSRLVVMDVTNMANDADLICFEGGINDYWRDVPLGTYSESDYSGTLDQSTICGALESIFRQATAKWVGKPICFVITHKITSTVYTDNTQGYNWTDVHEKIVGICKKYAIPYYDAFEESGLNAYNSVQNTNFLTSNSSGTPDGCHPNADGYKKFYVPQLIALFESIMPKN